MFAWVPSIPELLILLAVVLLLFGSRLPSLARSMGLSITEFKKGMKEIDHQPDEDKIEKSTVNSRANDRSAGV